MSHRLPTTMFAVLAVICLVGPWFAIRYLRFEAIEGQGTFVLYYGFGDLTELFKVEYDFDGKHHWVHPRRSLSTRAAVVGHSSPQAIRVYVRRWNPSEALTEHPQQWHFDNIEAVWLLAVLFGWMALASWRIGRGANVAERPGDLVGETLSNDEREALVEYPESL